MYVAAARIAFSRCPLTNLVLPLVEGGQWRPFLCFTVDGVAQPKGSARAYTYERAAAKGGGTGARVEMDGTRSKTWQRLVNQASWLALRSLPLARRQKRLGPLAVELHFWLPQPKKIPAIREHEPSMKPDVDKLVRAALDACTDVVWDDDAQIVLCVARKHYAPSLQVCRLEYTVAERIDIPELPLEP